MDERLRFVARLLDGEKMAVVCREFGVSRKTGHKIFNRYKDFGLRGLEDRVRSPYRHPNKLPFQVETALLRIKREHPSWGAPKIREKLHKDYPMVKSPAVSTVHAVPDHRPPRPGEAAHAPPLQGQRDGLEPPPSSKRAVVCRLQGPVPSGQPPLLLSANHY
jgi:transposase